MLVKITRTHEAGRAVLSAGQVHDVTAEAAAALIAAGDAEPYAPPAKRDAPPAPEPEPGPAPARRAVKE
jgi:hypothetical protein